MKVLTVPNLLTISRIIIIPIFIAEIIYEKYNYALYLFIIAALTDLFDGFLARLTDQKTALGKFLDPLADKFLLISSFIAFAVHGWIPLWLVIIVISRDVIVVTGLILLYMITHTAHIESVMLGKVAIAMQLIILAYVLLGINMPQLPALHNIFFIITAVITSLSGLQYIYRGLKVTDAVS